MSWKNWNAGKLLNLTAQAKSRAINAALETVGSASDQQVPLDEATLLRSKFIKVEGGDGLISYGGGAGTGHPRVPYAVRWHENSANFQHGRKKRYLADPFNKVGPRAYRRALKQELEAIW